MKYQVKDGIAVNSDTNEQYACEAHDGVYDAGCFGEPICQISDYGGVWYNRKSASRWGEGRVRYFIPFNPIPKMGTTDLPSTEKELTPMELSESAEKMADRYASWFGIYNDPEWDKLRLAYLAGERLGRLKQSQPK